ncbi:TIGR03757 family integrating conjugative element protein [Achromobacter pestifer]|uniref:TIGR03757 family integrating conjugative element protein n=1 Tax=Achromobacter pestifer TaxID=1353889 RepID=A0A6S6ZH10_9BURK|nr:TIGR03757 family integrating conjugative element protein [Achromobacter pestifer]CAB3647678.1 hypothetical protein LMG3431_02590 [Achromobacter pestifer]
MSASHDPPAIRAIGGWQLWLLLPSSALAFAANASAGEVWVVTDQHHAVKASPTVRVIELDAPSRIEAELSAELPTDPVQATTLVQRRLQGGGTALQGRIGNAYQGVIDAWSLGITTIPAVVVDRRYVVYGEPDVDKASARIEAYRRLHP